MAKVITYVDEGRGRNWDEAIEILGIKLDGSAPVYISRVAGDESLYLMSTEPINMTEETK